MEIKIPKCSRNNRGITCDVCQSQFSNWQHDGGGRGFSGGDTLLPGEVMLPGVANELDAFWNRDFHVNLWGDGAGEESVGRTDVLWLDEIMSPAQERPSLI